MFLFAYGTLLDKDVQLQVFGRSINGTPETLSDYRKVIKKFECGLFTDLVFEKGSSVEGLRFKLTEEDVSLSDRYEGGEYYKMKIVLGSGCRAIVYKGKEAKQLNH